MRKDERAEAESRRTTDQTHFDIRAAATEEETNKSSEVR